MTINITDEEFLAALDADEDDLAQWENYEGYSWESQVEQVATTLREIHTERDVALPFSFGWVGVIEAGIDAANVEVYLGEGRYLANFTELKHLTDDRMATGKEQALAIKTSLMRDYLRLREFAASHDLWVSR